MKTLRTVLFAAGLASTLAAQTEDPAQKARQMADEMKKKALAVSTFEFVSGQLISGPPVKGAPYSAEAVNETVQTLADGNRIVQRSSAMQYRDNDGRERREETSAMGAIFITDPVAGTRYTLHPEAKTAEKGQTIHVTSTGGDTFYYLNGAPAGAIPLPPLGGRSGGGQIAVRLQGPEESVKAAVLAGVRAAVSGDANVEQLGSMYIEGVQAEGTRTTTTIPAGQIGNDRPINIVDERWYSPDLQMTVMTKHSDPRMGETTFQLKNINRSSPPPYLFEIPSDYTVTTAGGGRGGRSGGPGPTIRLAEPKK